MKRILFRADDLGYSEGVNLGIAKSVKEGVIASVGLMSNMPMAKHGVELLKDGDVSLGLHCNISAGQPISPLTSTTSLIDENGLFKKTATYMKAGFDLVDLEEAKLEIEAQVQAFIRITGKKPSYMDGHAVASSHFFEAIQFVAQAHDILYSPLPLSEAVPVQIGKEKVFMHAGSSQQIGPFDTLHNIIEHMKEDECHMIVYHPGFVDAYLLDNSSLTIHRAIETEALCSKACISYINEQSIHQINYDDLIG